MIKIKERDEQEVHDKKMREKLDNGEFKRQNKMKEKEEMETDCEEP